MIKAGVTGGIGSGKSTLCRVWEELGARVVYADNLARELMVTDPELRKELIRLFGKQTYNEDGSLNKPHLIQQAFEEGRVDDLNEAVHPAVARAFKEECRKAEHNGVELIAEEAALLLNRGRPALFDQIVIVLSPEEEQISRVVKRDETDRDQIMARMEKQPDFRKLTHLADHVLINDGTLEEFKKKSSDLFHTILKA